MYVKQKNTGISQVHYNHLLLRAKFLPLVSARDLRGSCRDLKTLKLRLGQPEPPGAGSVGRRKQLYLQPTLLSLLELQLCI